MQKITSFPHGPLLKFCKLQGNFDVVFPCEKIFVNMHKNLHKTSKMQSINGFIPFSPIFDIMLILNKSGHKAAPTFLKSKKNQRRLSSKAGKISAASLEIKTFIPG